MLIGRTAVSSLDDINLTLKEHHHSYSTGPSSLHQIASCAVYKMQENEATRLCFQLNLCPSAKVKATQSGIGRQRLTAPISMEDVKSFWLKKLGVMFKVKVSATHDRSGKHPCASLYKFLIKFYAA